jgi:hypothetical protein
LKESKFARVRRISGEGKDGVWLIVAKDGTGAPLGEMKFDAMMEIWKFTPRPGIWLSEDTASAIGHWLSELRVAFDSESE